MDINGKQAEAELLPADKARSIYEDIVRKMRDPALLEYVGRDAFKVRIFPIEPHGTKHIKIKYTQVLSEDAGLVEYAYPLNTEKFSSRPIGEVSYGEKRRVEIAMALAQKPKLLLLDEPLAGLSLEERVAVKALIAGIPRDVTVVMIEHDMDTALDLAERITVLHYGSVIVEGTRSEVVADPKTREVYLGN